MSDITGQSVRCKFLMPESILNLDWFDSIPESSEICSASFAREMPTQFRQEVNGTLV